MNNLINLISAVNILTRMHRDPNSFLEVLFIMMLMLNHMIACNLNFHWPSTVCSSLTISIAFIVIKMTDVDTILSDKLPIMIWINIFLIILFKFMYDNEFYDKCRYLQQESIIRSNIKQIKFLQVVPEGVVTIDQENKSVHFMNDKFRKQFLSEEIRSIT